MKQNEMNPASARPRQMPIFGLDDKPDPEMAPWNVMFQIRRKIMRSIHSRIKRDNWDSFSNSMIS